MHDDTKDRLWALGIVAVMFIALAVMMFIH